MDVPRRLEDSRHTRFRWHKISLKSGISIQFSDHMLFVYIIRIIYHMLYVYIYIFKYLNIVLNFRPIQMRQFQVTLTESWDNDENARLSSKTIQARLLPMLSNESDSEVSV